MANVLQIVTFRVLSEQGLTGPETQMRSRYTCSILAENGVMNICSPAFDRRRRVMNHHVSPTLPITPRERPLQCLFDKL